MTHKIPKARFKHILTVFAVVLLFMGVVSLRGHATAASAGDVVINEIMYNPRTDNQNDEFLELYNTTASTIQLDGWCINQGVTLCFDNTHSIAANSYVVVSPSASRTLATYGATTLAEYTGNLSDGGESLRLIDQSSTVIDTLTYDDIAPWALRADASGSSLELKDYTSNNTLAANWGAGLGDDGTPGTVNSLYGLDPPQLTAGTVLATSQTASATPLVTVNAVNETDVELKYRVQFGAEQTLTMYDDGAHSDGASGDDVYGANIPAQAAGSLVRYRVVATNATDESTLPSTDDTQTYSSYIVDDGTSSDLPIVRWYIDDADFTDLTTNHLTDDVFVPAVVAVGNQVFDNTQVRIKGGSSPQFAKKKFKFELPNGYQIDQPEFDHPIDEFSLQVYFLNLGELQEGVALKAFEHFGFAAPHSQYVRVHKNDTGPSDFYGHYLFLEQYDKTWRETNNFDSGALYKEATDKKTRLNENSDDIDDMLDQMTNLTGDALKEYIYDNINVANVINYNAVMANTRNDDWNLFHNQYQYRDTEGTGRWEYLPWDNDNSFAPTNISALPYPRVPVMSLIPDPDLTFYDLAEFRYIEQAMSQFPEFIDMYNRRSASIHDEIQDQNLIQTWYEELMDKSYQTILDDRDVWGAQRQTNFDTSIGSNYSIFPSYDLSVPFSQLFTNGTPEDFQTIFNGNEDYFAGQVEDSRDDGDFPQRQSASASVQVTSAARSPEASNNDQYIELTNESDTAVDISGWQLQPVNYTFPSGTVIPANSNGYVAAKDTQFRSTYGTGSYILGEFSAVLNASTTSISLLRSDNSVSDTLSYVTATDPAPSSTPAVPGTTPGTVKKTNPAVATDTPAESADAETVQTPSDENCVQQGAVLNCSSQGFAQDQSAGGQTNTKRKQPVLAYVTGALLIIGGLWFVVYHKKRKHKIDEA